MDNFGFTQNRDSYRIEGTDLSPEININFMNNEILLMGVSLMADPVKFYGKVFSEIKQIVQQYKFSSLKVTFYLFYINTQSLKQLMIFFSYLEELDIPVEIVWIYSDEELAELGSHLYDLLELPFKLVYKPADKNLFRL